MAVAVIQYAAWLVYYTAQPGFDSRGGKSISDFYTVTYKKVFQIGETHLDFVTFSVIFVYRILLLS